VLVSTSGPVTVITINRPKVRNAVDRVTADALSQAFAAFDADPAALVAVLTGADGTFCAGADLGAIHTGGGNRVDVDMAADGPMGPTRMELSKPVIAAVEGYAVAGGLELAVWCDLRVMAADATFGVYCRRWGVPLVDGGTVRLPRLVGHGRAMDMVLTGRPVDAAEALAIGLADRVVPSGQACDAAVALATDIAALPQRCMRSDRASLIEQWSLDHAGAMANETRRGLEVIASGETLSGAGRFAAGAGRHGAPQ
jgi:enoyl-CoA hydratase